MQALRGVILEHVARSERHLDLLMETPGRDAGHGPLWAARWRTTWPLGHGPRAVVLETLPPHRRRYLTYQGPLSGGRGRVRRMAGGVVVPTGWTPWRIDVCWSLPRFTLVLGLNRRGPVWVGRAEPQSKDR